MPARSGGLELPAGTHVLYRDDGSLRLVQPPRDLVLRGIPVPGGSTVEIDESGAIISATLSRAWHAHAAGETVFFGPDGGVEP